MPEQFSTSVSGQPQPELQTPPPVSQQIPPKGGKSRKKLALFLIIAPFAGIIGSVILYAIIAFVMGAILAGTADQVTNGVVGLATQPSIGFTIARIVNAVLGLIGLLSVLGIFTALPAGIILLVIDKSKNN